MKATLCLPTKADAWFPGAGKTQPQGTERGSGASPARRLEGRQGLCGGVSRVQPLGWSRRALPRVRNPSLPHPGVPGLSPPIEGWMGLKVGGKGVSLSWGLRCREPFPGHAAPAVSCPQAGRPSSAPPGSP